MYRFLRQRHFWRFAGFDELSEIYVSMMLRSLSLSLIGVFIPVYLIELGYGVPGIISFFICFFAVRAIADIVAGFTVARFGPKHTMLMSYFLQIIAALFFVTLPDRGWSLVLPAAFWGASNSLFFIAFHVDFSKIKHSKHGGKELGFVNIMEKIGGAIGPLIGGVVALIFGAEYTFLVAAGLLMLGLIPLFQTSEPIKTHQKLNFKLMPMESIKRDLFCHTFFGIENNLCLALWPAFLTLFVLGENVYIEVGFLTSIGMVASLFATYTIGKLIDQRHGRKLLRISAVGNAILHGIRPFVSNLYGAFGVNVVNDILTVGYRLPYTKGWYDAADDLPGRRIMYLTTMEAFSSYTKLIVWGCLLIASWLLGDRALITLGFGIAGVSSLLIMTEKFRALRA